MEAKKLNFFSFLEASQNRAPGNMTRHQVILSCCDLVLGASRRQLLGGVFSDAHTLLDYACKHIRVINSSELSITICSDEFSKAVNRRTRGKDVATDVISLTAERNFEDFEDVLTAGKYFEPSHYSLVSQEEIESEEASYEESDLTSSWFNDKWQCNDSLVLGDIVISLETSERQSLLPRDEVRVLMVHGILHLFGYDHEKGQKEFEEMMSLEKKTLHNLGWRGFGLCQTSEQ